jgi:hypothetical protein
VSLLALASCLAGMILATGIALYVLVTVLVADRDEREIGFARQVVRR